VSGYSETADRVPESIPIPEGFGQLVGRSLACPLIATLAEVYRSSFVVKFAPPSIFFTGVRLAWASLPFDRPSIIGKISRAAANIKSRPIREHALRENYRRLAIGLLELRDSDGESLTPEWLASFTFWIGIGVHEGAFRRELREWASSILGYDNEASVFEIANGRKEIGVFVPFDPTCSIKVQFNLQSDKFVAQTEVGKTAGTKGEVWAHGLKTIDAHSSFVAIDDSTRAFGGLSRESQIEVVKSARQVPPPILGDPVIPRTGADLNATFAVLSRTVERAKVAPLDVKLRDPGSVEELFRKIDRFEEDPDPEVFGTMGSLVLRFQQCLFGLTARQWQGFISTEVIWRERETEYNAAWASVYEMCEKARRVVSSGEKLLLATDAAYIMVQDTAIRCCYLAPWIDALRSTLSGSAARREAAIALGAEIQLIDSNRAGRGILVGEDPIIASVVVGNAIAALVVADMLRPEYLRFLTDPINMCVPPEFWQL
jgi:hypothetical protein